MSIKLAETIHAYRFVPEALGSCPSVLDYNGEATESGTSLRYLAEPGRPKQVLLVRRSSHSLSLSFHSHVDGKVL